MSQIKLAALILLPLIHLVASDSSSFTFNGFSSANLTLDGVATVAENGLLHLANDTREAVGHAFYPTPIIFKNSSNSSLFSFSTHFVFAIVPDAPNSKNAGHGMTFVIAPAPRLPGSTPNIYLGLLNESSNGDSLNHVFAVELDQLKNDRFKEPDDNHVGIDVNSMVSVVATPAAYYDGKTQSFRNLSLINGRRMQVWVDYDGVSEILNVTLAPVENGGFKPRVPLISLRYDLAPVLNRISYVGFSAAPLWTSYYVLGWSFSINGGSGGAPPLDLSRLPKLPRVGPKKQSKFVTVGLPLISVFVLVMTVFIVAYYYRMKWKFAEVLEDWETEYDSHRFKYKDLYKATKGFREGELLGRGGFGKVYRGVMPNSKIEVAVKKISHESWQGMKEFVAEIVSIGRLRHRNLVALLGYCRRKGELLLVYDYMPNGSLDKYLHNNPVVTLSWDQRFRVIKGAASGILYLHEEWEQVVIHRDIKASNILLDGEFSARLGDFGLARLYDHGSDSQTTHIVGTLGYLAPEHTQTGRATTSTDVYAFGAFLLEVGCGRRPIEPKGQCEKSNLLEWVFSMWSKGEIVGAVDQNLGGNYDKNEVELVLKLGLLCCHSRPEVRPKMRDVVRFLEGEMDLPELTAVGFGESGHRSACYEGFDGLGVSYNFSSTAKTISSSSTSVTNSVIFSGR